MKSLKNKEKMMKHKAIGTFLLAMGLALSSQAALTAWWNFEETNLPANGDRIYDEVGGTPARMWNTAWSGLSVPGKFGNPSTGGVYFDGVTDNMEVANADAGALQSTGSFSMAMWFKPDGVQVNWARLIDSASNVSGGPQNGWRVTKTNVDGTLQFAAKTGSGNVTLNSTDSYQNNVWNLLVVRYDVSGNASLNILTEGDTVNAAFVAANLASGATGGAVTYPGAATRIGSALGSSSVYEYKGYMDDLAFFDSVLTDADVATIFNSGVAAIPEPGTLVMVAASGAAILFIRRKFAI